MNGRKSISGFSLFVNAGLVLRHPPRHVNLLWRARSQQTPHHRGLVTQRLVLADFPFALQAVHR